MFWDASAIVPLLMEESASALCRSWLAEDREVMVWFLSPTESISAIRRKCRMGEMDEELAEVALGRLRQMSDAWTEVQGWYRVRERAHRLLALHDLRTADSLQLAAAVVASQERPRLLPFVCLDQRLRFAARREGFSVLTGS
jgi:predicted nucleic acid-binding protein